MKWLRHRKVKKLKFIQSNGSRICSLQYGKDETVLFLSTFKTINNSQLRGKAVPGSWSV